MSKTRREKKVERTCDKPPRRKYGETLKGKKICKKAMSPCSPNSVSMSFQSQQMSAFHHIPEADGVVARARHCKPLADPHAADSRCMPIERVEAAPRMKVPHAQRTVARAADD